MAFFAELLSSFKRLPASVWHDLRPSVNESESAAKRLRRSFILHLHPLKVSERALAPTTTFGLGLASIALFLVLFTTGLLLMLYYVPTPRDAYASVLDIEHAVTFGRFVRRLHRFAAHGMVAVVALHLVRVMAQAAYRHRELNWLVGLLLLASLLGLAFTGYLLPWDQTSYWAVRVVTNMMEHVPIVGRGLKWLLMGGSTVGAATLVRFYALHVAILPFVMLLLVALHLWRIRKDGGLATSVTDSQMFSAWPHLVQRVGLVMLVVTTAVVIVSLFVEAPLGPPADLLKPSNPEKAPWYFLGLQEMVSYSAIMGGVIFPVLTSLLLLIAPFLDREEKDIGVWLGDSAQHRLLAVSAAVSGVLLVVSGAVFMSTEGAAWVAELPSWLQDLVNPAAGALVWAIFAFFVAGFRSGSSRVAMRAGLAALGLAIALFTLVGMCRGPDWIFYWPWQEWIRVR